MWISGAGHSADTFPKDAGVTVVPGVLLDHLHTHPPKADLEPAHGPTTGYPPHGVERESGTHLPPSARAKAQGAKEARRKRRRASMQGRRAAWRGRQCSLVTLWVRWFAAYATAPGRALVDQELYLPKP